MYHVTECERHVWIAGGAYDCSYLTDSSNKYGIYQNRRKFCNNGVADCCITCDRVRKVAIPAYSLVFFCFVFLLICVLLNR